VRNARNEILPGAGDAPRDGPIAPPTSPARLCSGRPQSNVRHALGVTASNRLPAQRLRFILESGVRAIGCERRWDFAHGAG
jgi:hypothetical protein